MWEKQAEALKVVKKKVHKLGGFGLFMEMGTGKSRVAIHLLEDLIENHGVSFIGVGAPLSVLRVWVEAWHEWGKTPILFIDLHDTGPEGLRQAQEMSKHQPVICLINYESSWQMGTKRVKKVNKKGETKITTVKVDTTLDDFDWDVFILDESTAIKTPGSKVSKFMRNTLAKKCDYRLCLTGSAYIKRPLDVWAQIQFILNPDKHDPLPLFPKTFEFFKGRYSIPHPVIRGAIKGYQNLDDLVIRLNKVAILLKKEDVLDLPPATHEPRFVQMSKETKKLYDELKENQYLELENMEKEGRTVTAAHIFSLMQKQMQLTSGFLKTDAELDPETGLYTKKEIIRTGTEKLNELILQLEDREDPTLIITQWDEEEKMIVEAIQKKFDFTPKVLNGSVKGGEARHDMVRGAAKDLCFVVKESVGSKGLDMRYADMTIWYSHSHDTEDYDQMMARNHRGGQTKPITYRHLIMENTIDEKIMFALNRDLSLAAELEENWRRLFE
jgi:SNF2 family DNA or RNA helicase